MPVNRLGSLDSESKKKLHELLSSCRKHEPVSVSFPEEEADFYLFFSDGDGRLLSAAAFTGAGEGTYECTAFTKPGFRRQGLFSFLLSEALSMLPEETELLFYTDNQSAGALGALAAIGASRLFDEHMMELAPGPYPGAKDPAVSEEASEDPETGRELFLFQSPYGSLKILSFPGHYYLFGFEILPEFRGRGPGKKIVCHVLHELSRKAPLPVRLQVSGDNAAALSLYEKTGFQITETLSCYLY